MGSLPKCAVKSATHCWTEEPGVAPQATFYQPGLRVTPATPEIL